MPTFTLIDDESGHRVVIECLKTESYCMDSQLWAVSVSHAASHRYGAFHGTVNVWLLDSDIKKFLTQFSACDELRQGEAKLEAMSPNEFSLRIFNTKSKGDFAIDYYIGYQTLQSSGHVKAICNLDPSLLSQMMRDFETFLEGQIISE
jgi:hypothetical protein